MRLLLKLFILSNVSIIPGYSQNTENVQPFPFSTDSTHITVWNGERYVPLFIKGINLGVSVPGSFPGDLAASADDYARWFHQIRDAGFNTIRIYTLHFPRFYDELLKFNINNPNHPLLVFQGIWLEESIPGYDNDLYNLTASFDDEIRNVIDAVHGNAIIPDVQGNAHGTYFADISPWVIGYIAGREIHPPEVLTTNESHISQTSYGGAYFSIDETNATEAWVVERLDNLVAYELEHYDTQRPVSISSWPTLDPLDHPEEENNYEVMASIDLSNVDLSNAKAGLFISYHAYPYYPDYVSRDPRYTSFFDHLGQNSYLGYLTYLKNHYEHFPLIIAEIGGPSSWGIAHYAHNGIHHGGYDERAQGEHNLRLLRNIHAAGGGGGIQFSWMDEWFKRTWVTDPVDFDPDRRIIWHNITAAEQNFGLIGFRKQNSETQLWETFIEGWPVESIEAGADFAYLRFSLNTPDHFAIDDTLWLSFDTYDSSIGESVLPAGHVVDNRAEFTLMVTSYKAELYVTEAYDLFGIWHGTSGPEQLYRSVATDGAPWKIVRWKNNDFDEEVQFIGNMQVNRLNLPQSSLDAVRIFDDRIEIRLPWTLINVIDPSVARVMHDDRNTPETETRISDGISVGIFYNEFETETTERFLWQPWNHALDAIEYKKASYEVVSEDLVKLPGNPIAKTDTFQVAVDHMNQIPAVEGVLVNDLSLDGTGLSALIDKTPQHGIINLEPDGSFSYIPETGRTGTDSFTYRVRAGYHLSEPVSVQLELDGTPTGSGFVNLYPNPSDGNFTIRSTATIDYLEIFSVLGQLIVKKDINNREASISLEGYTPGVYFARIHSGEEYQLKKFMILR